MPSASEQHQVLTGYLSPAQLAKELGKSTRTVDRWRAEGRGPAPTMIGCTIVYSVESVRSWLRSQERPMPRATKHRLYRGRRETDRTATSAT